MDNHSNLALITSPASTMKVRNISVLSLLFLSFFSNLAFAVNNPPQVGTITPSSGSSQPEVLNSVTTTYTDPDGWRNLQYANLLVNASAITKTNCFYGYYNQNTNKLYLRNDADTAWLGGYLPGSANTIENSYAKLNCAQTTVSGSGTTLTVQWAVTFKQPFTGAKKTYLYVRDDANAYNGWTQKGTWAINNPPIITQIIPANNATFTEGDSIVISATAQDTNGNPLEYQFSIDGQIVRTWSSLNTFNWQTQTGDIHLKTITVEARDSYQGTASGQTQVFLYRRVPSP